MIFVRGIGQRWGAILRLRSGQALSADTSDCILARKMLTYGIISKSESMNARKGIKTLPSTGSGSVNADSLDDFNGWHSGGEARQSAGGYVRVGEGD